MKAGIASCGLHFLFACILNHRTHVAQEPLKRCLKMCFMSSEYHLLNEEIILQNPQDNAVTSEHCEILLCLFIKLLKFPWCMLFKKLMAIGPTFSRTIMVYDHILNMASMGKCKSHKQSQS